LQIQTVVEKTALQLPQKKHSQGPGSSERINLSAK